MAPSIIQIPGLELIFLSPLSVLISPSPPRKRVPPLDPEGGGGGTLSCG